MENFTLKDFIEVTNVRISAGKTVRPIIILNDGHAISIQASLTHYCEPRRNPWFSSDTYQKMEVGFPTFIDPDLDEWAETMPIFDDNGEMTDEEEKTGVYGWVPVDILQKVIDKHGGIDYHKTMNLPDKEKRALKSPKELKEELTEGLTL